MDVLVRRSRGVTLWLVAVFSILGAVALVSTLFSAGSMVVASDTEMVLLLLLMVLPLATIFAVRMDRRSAA
jgi:hypothetical protein